VNNLKQVALAMHNHHDIKKELPRIMGPYGCCWGTWPVLLLQFVEQENVFRLYQNWGGNDAVCSNYPAPSPPGAAPRYGAAPNTTNVTTRRYSVFTCPSDIPNAPIGGITNHNYTVCGGTGGTYRSVPSGAPAGFVAKAGMFDGGSLNRKTQFSDVTDGLSNTLMIGEVLQGQGTDLRGFFWWGDASAMSTFAPPNTSTPDQIYTAVYCNNQPPLLPCTGTGGAVFYSRSLHPGGVNSALGDGSVRFVSSTINSSIWLGLGTPSDGEVVSLN
jgi:hypothetical protein